VIVYDILKKPKGRKKRAFLKKALSDKQVLILA
jgi:hypothetical protein